MRGIGRIAVVTSAAVIAILSSTAVADARSNTYSATSVQSTASFALSQATYYAQSQGYAAGYRLGECPVSSQSVQPFGSNYMATVYVTCYQP
ncbi:MAG: hypothetical protein JOZ47_06630 [Kutzneria sp.]|nr:hypothetical protein [Kutzneria sp.]MBV9844730.1 hypothetical protein [Kutzneria sp.]